MDGKTGPRSDGRDDHGRFANAPLGHAEGATAGRIIAALRLAF